MAAAASLSASSALADAGQTYVKANAGYAKFNNEKLKEGGDSSASVKLKAKSGSLAFALGTGYYFTDIIRGDATLEYFSNIEHKISNVSLKSRSFAGMFNGYVDFAEIKDIKFFAGAGVGVVRTQANLKYNNALYEITRKDTLGSLAYALHLGASTKVVDKVNVELGWI